MTHRDAINRIFACVLALGIGGATLLAAGCAAKKPMVLEEMDDLEGDEIMQEPGAEVGDGGDFATTTPEVSDPRVERLEADVAKLQVETAKVREQVGALNTRVERVETTVNTTTQQMTERFANFDAELARIRDTMVKPKDSASAKPVRDMEAEVAIAVDSWRQAWQQKELDAYMRLYHPNAQIVRMNVGKSRKYVERRMTPVELRPRMAAIIRSYARMEVVVRDFRVASDGNRMVATFHQEFTAWTRPRDMKPAYMDRGLKTLVFVPSNGGWQIVSESWTPSK
jgi:ketosteroid isomerase-like protein